MKKKSFVVLLMLIMSFSLNGYAEDSINTQVEINDKINFSAIDSVAARELGSSADVIFGCDSIKAELIAWEQDSAQSGILPQWMNNLVKYTLCSPAMYKSNKKVYSRFEPYAWFTFSNGKGKLMLLLDYSINKWMLKEDNGNILAIHDLPNKEFLLMLRLLFPESELIKIKYNEYIQSL